MKSRDAEVTGILLFFLLNFEEEENRLKVHKRQRKEQQLASVYLFPPLYFLIHKVLLLPLLIRPLHSVSGQGNLLREQTRHAQYPSIIITGHLTDKKRPNTAHPFDSFPDLQRFGFSLRWPCYFLPFHFCSICFPRAVAESRLVTG